MTDAIRLTFAVSDGQVTLVSRQPVEMTLPASPSPPSSAREIAPHPDFFAEVRDANDRALHRAAMPNPLEPHREAFSDDPDHSIHRVPVSQPQSVFTLVVPNHPEADHVSLMLAGAAHRDFASELPAAAGPREIARIPLGEPEGPQP
jgi:hypothetical protein